MVTIRKSKIGGVLLWRSTANRIKMDRKRILVKFKLLIVLSTSKKKITKCRTVYAVAPFKKRCDNFDAEFIYVLFAP